MMVGIKFALAAGLLIGSVVGSPFKSGPITQDSSSHSTSSSSAAKKQGDKPQPKVVPNAYIVQLHNKGPIEKRAADLHEAFHLAAKRDSDIDYSVRETFSSDSTFVGLSLTLKSGDVETLKNLDNVAEVWPVKTVPRPFAAIQRPALKPRYDSAPVAGTDFSLPHITGADLDVNRPHQMTGVDKAHDAGIKGKGMKIAILDSGVDYRHPSLGGCFGQGCKVGFGYDLVGDGYDPDNGIPAVEDKDPLVNCKEGGHGTHVSGIIGMLDQPGTGYGLVGVAPEATIGMYRIFGCSGGSEDDVIIKALLMAADSGADVISMSFGQLWSDEESNPYDVISTSLVDRGVALIAANGNAGSYGEFSGSSPALSKDVFAVGSVDNEKYPLTYALTDSNGRTLRYSSHLPQSSPPDGLIVQVMSYGAEEWMLTGAYIDLYEEAAKNLTALGIDPANVVLATKYGDYAPEDKATVAASYGYKYFISYALETDDAAYGKEYYVSSPESQWPIEPLVLTVKDSKTLLSSYGKQPLKYKISLSSTNYIAKSTTASTAGFMSNYSSFGPTTQLNIKPQLSAPGGNILSTWPLIYDGYVIISGTSMSTPYMAGAYALLKSQHPTLPVRTLYKILQNTGTPLNWLFNQNIKSAAIHQGSGLLNLHNALTWESHVSPPQLNAGKAKDWETWNNSITVNFTISNRSPRAKTYTFEHAPAGLMQNLYWHEDSYNNMYPYYGDMKFHVESITVEGGKEGVVFVDIVAPKPDRETWGDDAINLLVPVYSGFITVKNNYERFVVPYAGQLWDYCRWGGEC